MHYRSAMKRNIATLLAFAAGIALLLATTQTADAKRARKRFRTDKEFGIGLMVGAPSGLSAKYYLGEPIALAFGLGSSHYGHHYRDDRWHNHGVHFHTDVLWHPVVLTNTRSLQLPLFIGVGGMIRNHEDADGRDDHSHIGARVPFGIAMDFNNVPLDIFFELAFTLDFVGPDNRTYIAGSLGARYYF